MKTATTLTFLLLAGVALPALAQGTASPAAPAPSSPAPASSAPTSSAPANPPGVSATAGNPNLSVATVKLDSGVRVSKIVGVTVYGSDSKDLGKIDDLVMTANNEVTLAVVSVGGFLGVGSKMVAFPYKALQRDGDRLTLPGVTPDSLNAMPSFEY